MIGTVLDIVDATGKLLDANKSVTDAIGTAGKAAVAYTDAKRAVMSIAEKSKKSIMMYKVWMSASIRETETAMQINKWLENMYGVFTMLVLGFNPTAGSNNELNDIVSGISAESFKPDYNTKAEERALESGMVMLDSERTNGQRKPRIGKNAVMSEESTAPADFDNHTQRNDKVEEVKFINDVTKQTSQAYPTIINMKVRVGGETMNIPLAIKCNLYPIGSEETRLIIESGISGKMLSFLRRVKWRSGEISTLAWIFNTDIAERSKKLYEKLGRNPMYQELMQRKAAAKRSFWGKFLTRFGSEFAGDADDKKEFKTINANIGNVPPTSSLIVSKDDIVAATRLNIEHFTKNDGFVNRFLKDNFLPCLGIVDNVAAECTFFMMGYKNPFKISFESLKNQSNPDKALQEAIRNLSMKV